MKFGERLLPKLEEYRGRSSQFMKKVAVTTLALSTLTFASASADDTDKELKTIYHVYVNSHYVGAVTDQDDVKGMLEEKLQDAEEKFKDYQVTWNNDITYIPENVFSAKTNNQEVLNNVSKSMAVEANAYALVVDDKPVAYVKDKETADEALKKIKLKYVSEDELKDLEARENDADSSLPALKENETRLLDVSFKEDVAAEKSQVDPKEILSADEAVNLLLKGSVEEKKYKVEEGDVLGAIAEKLDLTTGELLKLNPELDEDGALKIGSELNVTVSKPFVHTVVKKEVNKIEKIAYDKEVIEDSSMNKGDTKVKQEGVEGEKSVTFTATEVNGSQTEKNVTEEKDVKEPQKYIVIKGTKETPSRGSGSFAWPTNGGYISSKQGQRWGKMHKGIDIARPSDKTIKSVDNGVVVSAGWDDGGYGNKVVIDHQNGYKTTYAHLDSISVSAGQKVGKGDKLGIMGTTGQSTGVHLHIEVHKNGSLINPLDVLHK
ncbi:peptidase M23 [[Bacillus] enclensis]|uniref:Murein DD-endopeptidase MepM and murein hydrolase activator NlpD, contain LysM domain n=1 Tax=[Bacillus] enclensis TaxID=1402860 RepID=A0A0V8H9G7_9BACI|nr:M23 family metallopeptidase [[Bacillus] enclensis]KSU59072.1 peptidase M23 [[Bacillus] enclensis]SCC32071.1 Murein DD-endopeptidase MepM and murein hydrolase activator NlpD, contain LysM domain [[Bacillus] enclensis]